MRSGEGVETRSYFEGATDSGLGGSYSSPRSMRSTFFGVEAGAA